MTQHYRSVPVRRRRRPVRLAAAIADDDNFGLEVQNRGIGRVFGVVLLMHAVVIGGIVAYKSISREPGAAGDSSSKAPLVYGLEEEDFAGPPDRREETDDLLPPRKVRAESVVVDHPEMEGHMRYRVGEGEELIEIVRQFNASVAEVEKLNNLKPGDPLYTGQWLTVPDNTADGVVPVLSPESKPIKAVVITESKPVQIGEMKATVERTPAPGSLSAPAPPHARPPDGGRGYTVVRGDTAYAIARRHNVDWKRLLEMNGMDDPRQLKAGQVIRIP